jgi:hypothetical protein
MMLVSGVLVALARLDGGRAYERINRAFFVSFVIAAASFLTFAFAVHHPA